MIQEALAGKRLLVTGSTGFLGTALVERLLRAVPDCRLVLLVRPGRRSSVQQRAAREIFRNDAFDRLREQHGADGFAAMLEERVEVIAGDVSTDGLGLDDAGREIVRSCDIVIHSAATVSFDSPLDSAVEVNLLGPTRIARTLHDLDVAPHFIAVSTCYVAGSRRGSAAEQLIADSPFHVPLDWQAEVDAARACRREAQIESRTTDKLDQFRSEARSALGPAGGPLLAARTEQIRDRWVDARMVELGKARAASVGFPDVYAYTKALAEQALTETHGSIPTSIVRPSIIESAVSEPSPGWIRGFRMAEPVIISYARGLLTEFPGVPEGVVDVIPVDLVVASIIAVAADEQHEPRADPTVDPVIFQVASGDANPLRYRKLVDLVSGWFTEHPLYDTAGQPIMVPEWSYPARGRVQGQLKRALTALDTAEKALGTLPLRGRQTRFGMAIEERKELASRAMGYVELYGAYAECEAIYSVDRLLELWDRQSTDDQAEFAFDPRTIDWSEYVSQVHLPSIVQHARVRTSPTGRTGPTREERLRSQVLSPDRQFAAFDLENTLIASNVVTSYAWLATKNLEPRERARFVVETIAEAPQLLALDRRDRSDFLRYFYRRYDGAPVAQIERDTGEMFSDYILHKAYPEAVRRVREHRRLGHRTVLITGALEFVVEPLAPLFDDIVCTRMSQDAEGRYTGELDAAPPTAESRAQVLIDYADQNGFDLAEGVAYADSSSDLPMLDVVGFPVAVNPETRLASLARKRGWLVEDFTRARGGPRKLIPMAARQYKGA